VFGIRPGTDKSWARSHRQSTVESHRQPSTDSHRHRQSDRTDDRPL